MPVTSVLSAQPDASDPLAILREYGALAPWGLRDLAALAGAILDASGVTPINAASRAHPGERTIRFYVTRGLVNPPEGRGTAAVYTYRHLLQVLAIKLRQMEGATLETITGEMREMTGDMIERRVAQTLGAALPAPSRLALLQAPGTGRGRVGRALQAWIAAPSSAEASRGTVCRRIPVAPGVELLLDEQHPVARIHSDADVIGDAVRRALASLLPPH